jgi:hypothetical protein
VGGKKEENMGHKKEENMGGEEVEREERAGGGSGGKLGSRDRCSYLCDIVNSSLSGSGSDQTRSAMPPSWGISLKRSITRI